MLAIEYYIFKKNIDWKEVSSSRIIRPPKEAHSDATLRLLKTLIVVKINSPKKKVLKSFFPPISRPSKRANADAHDQGGRVHLQEVHRAPRPSPGLRDLLQRHRRRGRGSPLRPVPTPT